MKRRLRFSIVISLACILAQLGLPMQPVLAGQIDQSDPCQTVPMVDSTLPLPAELSQSISTALCRRAGASMPGDLENMIVTSFDLYENNSWAILTVVTRPEVMPAEFESLLQFGAKMALGEKVGKEWRYTIEGEAGFDETVRRAPESVFTDQAKSLLLGSVTPASPSGLPGSLGLKWPWREGQQWKYTNGPHQWSYNDNVQVDSSLDFAANRDLYAPQDWEVRAAATGVVKVRCSDGVQVDAVLAHNTNTYTTAYLHLAAGSTGNLQNGFVIGQGDRMGITLNRFDFTSSCGHGDGPHLHFYVGTYSATGYPETSIVGTDFSGWTLQSGGQFTKSGQTAIVVNNFITSDNESPQTVSLGQTRSGQIDPAGEEDIYYFNGTQGQTVTIAMNKTSGNLDCYIKIYRPSGSTFAYHDYNDDANGSYDSYWSRQLPATGKYMVIARAYPGASTTGGYTISISVAGGGASDTDDNRWLAVGQWLGGSINPSSDQDTYYFNGTSGRIVNIKMEKTSGSSLDSLLELYAPNGSKVAEDDDGGGYPNSWISTVLTSNGTYRVKARSYNGNSSGSYNIRLTTVDSTNYALNKPCYSTSNYSSGYACSYAFDGNGSTRWSSQFSDFQYIYVDLGQQRTFDRVRLAWEAAYGRNYGIQVYSPGGSWSWVYYTTSGRGGTETISFPMTTARYVAMVGLQRGTTWGYSLWDFAVYNSTYALPPTVPPGDPEKDPDTIEDTAPLPLPEEEAGKEVVALYLGDGETYQEVMATAGEESPDPASNIITDTVGLPVGQIDSIVPGYPGHGVRVNPFEDITFNGTGADGDFDGDPGIVAYQWVSDRDGALSSEASFTLPASQLSIGTHIISFRVQDNEGNWSDWASVTIVIEGWLFLPVSMRQ